MNLQQPIVGNALVLQAISLQFQIVIIFPEDLSILARRLRCAGQILLPDQVGHLTTEAAG